MNGTGGDGTECKLIFQKIWSGRGKQWKVMGEAREGLLFKTGRNTDLKGARGERRSRFGECRRGVRFQMPKRG